LAIIVTSIGISDEKRLPAAVELAFYYLCAE
jgi:hypothetical protein